MERIHIHTPEDIPPAAQKAAHVVKQGGVILYPTDTLYGLGADALSDTAVKKIYTIKGRNEGKPIHALVSDIEMAAQYVDIDENTKEKIAQLIPRPITWICKKKSGLKGGIANNIETFGFRIPNNEFCLALARAFGGPITATSANKAGEPPLENINDILAQLGEAGHTIDLVIDAGVLPPSLPSTVVDITGTEPAVLREGAVPSHELVEMLRS